MLVRCLAQLLAPQAHNIPNNYNQNDYHTNRNI